MKAPQDCTGVNVKLEAKKSKKKKKKGAKGDVGDDADGDSVFGNGSLRRSSTDSSVAPSIVTPTSPTRNTSIVSSIRSPNLTRKSSAPQQEKYVSTSPKNTNGGSAGGLKAKVLYKYDATSAEELSVKPGDLISVLEKDDGSGWITGRIGRDEGIVPASYVEIQQSSGVDVPKKGPPVAPRRGAKKVEESKKKKMFRALYDYDANTELELSVREGDVLGLVADDKGDGWTEVEVRGKVGSVPSNYIEPV